MRPGSEEAIKAGRGGPFKGRNRAASAEQLEVMQSYNSQETTIFFCGKPKFVARRRSERKHFVPSRFISFRFPSLRFVLLSICFWSLSFSLGDVS